MGTTRRGRVPPTRLVSLAEGAESIGVSVSTLRRYITSGKLTGYRVGERLLRVDPEELEKVTQVVPRPRRSA